MGRKSLFRPSTAVRDGAGLPRGINQTRRSFGTQQIRPVSVGEADEADLDPDRPTPLTYSWNRPKAFTISRFVASVRSRSEQLFVEHW